MNSQNQPTKTVTVKQLEQIMHDPEADLLILDVRQMWEVRLARLEDPRVSHLPMEILTNLAHEQLPAPDEGHLPIYVLCHHGLRSAVVTRWLEQQGWHNSFNVAGGLEQYRLQIDPSIGRY